MIETWIGHYFSDMQMDEVLAILSEYGGEEWHREEERVKRDAVILSRGSLELLRSAIELARRDYREILVSEEVDPWGIGELRKHLS